MHWIHHASGRWNRQGEYGALYTSLHPFGALLELAKFLGKVGLTPSMTQPRDLVSVLVELDSVLDLRHADWILAYPRWTSRVLSDSAESYEICRSMADDAIAMGYSAIRVPSSIMPATKAMDNLVIFPHTRPDQWSVLDGADRIQLDDESGGISTDAWNQVFQRYPELRLPGMDLWI